MIWGAAEHKAEQRSKERKRSMLPDRLRRGCRESKHVLKGDGPRTIRLRNLFAREEVNKEATRREIGGQLFSKKRPYSSYKILISG